MAVVIATSRISDPDYWFFEALAGKAHCFCERAAKVKRKILVAIVGKAAREPLFCVVHHFLLLGRYRLSSLFLCL